MRLEDGRYDCDFCGAVLDIPPGAVPYPVIDATHGKPAVRVLMANGEELHRCPAKDSAETVA